MALKEKTVYKGMPAEYWRLGDISVNLRAQNKDGLFHVRARMDLYGSEKAREDNLSNFLTYKEVCFQSEGIPTYKEAYEKVKEDDAFKTAKDC